MKKNYQKPSLVEYGSVEQITRIPKGTGSGDIWSEQPLCKERQVCS